MNLIKYKLLIRRIRRVKNKNNKKLKNCFDSCYKYDNCSPDQALFKNIKLINSAKLVKVNPLSKII